MREQAGQGRGLRLVGDVPTDVADEETPITWFTGRWRGLSNFAPSQIVVDGVVYKSVEQAFQVAKTLKVHERKAIMAAHTPGEVKRLGRKVTLRPGWESGRVEVMRRCLRAKFSLPGFRELLLSTGERELVEGNHWHDNDWGRCSCRRCASVPAKNLLGRLLMEIRTEIQEEGTARRHQVSGVSSAASS